MKIETVCKYYAVAYHGTNGFESYGYAEVLEDTDRTSDMTTTVYGPYDTREEAQTEVDKMNNELDAYRAKREER